MKKRLALALGICALVVFSYLSSRAADERRTLKRAIEEIVTGDLFFDDGSDFSYGVIMETPYEAAGLLIDNLHTVDTLWILNNNDREKPKETWRVINSLYALGVITGGKRFTSSTDYVFPEPTFVYVPFGDSPAEYRKFWLTRKGRDKMPFYAVWPSRGSIYIAPKDVQEKVIRKWKDWYKKEGKTYNYRLLRGDFDFTDKEILD